VAQSQNALMSQLKDLISNEMGKVQDQQQRIAETQITKIEATLSDGHKFKRRGNEEQFKHNNLNNFFSFSESSASGFGSYYCTTLHPRSEESAILIIFCL
jgi:hypothetical protein